jgi:cellulose synthase/poly-beta-1,6-N-acetylglucosamine synthase-like glycosyltransferase
LLWRFTIINWHIWYGPLTYGAELFGVITTALFLWMTQKIYDPVYRQPTRQYCVDVFVTCYNEPLDTVRPTVEAAMRIRGINQVYVLDDGNRSEIKQLAQSAGARYYGRTSNLHAKAGNLNNGLKYSVAEFILTLDADHIPSPHILERMMGYFDDPNLGFVQSPQIYYNHGSFLFRCRQGKLWSEQGMFYDVIQPAKNRWNSAFFVGTSAVLRRAALDSVGGFATGTATEDIHTSLRLHARGWKSVFVPEPLAHGLEAESLKEYYKQRRRWAAGSLGLLFRSPDSPFRAQGLSLAQRLNYLSSTLAHLSGVQKLYYFFLPCFCIVTLGSPVTINLQLAALIFFVFVAASLLITNAYARGTYDLIFTESYSLISLTAHLAGLWGIIKVQKKFSVSSKLPLRYERTRLKTGFWLMVVIGVAAIYRAIVVVADSQQTDSHFWTALYSSLFVLMNLWILSSFLVYLLIYELSDVGMQHSNKQPEGLQMKPLRPAILE